MGWNAGVIKVRNHDFNPMCFPENVVGVKIWNILPVHGVTLDGTTKYIFTKTLWSLICGKSETLET